MVGVIYWFYNFRIRNVFGEIEVGDDVGQRPGRMLDQGVAQLLETVDIVQLRK